MRYVLAPAALVLVAPARAADKAPFTAVYRRDFREFSVSFLAPCIGSAAIDERFGGV